MPKIQYLHKTRRGDAFLEANGYENDFSAERMHHEIYLSDARRVPPERRKTVIRHPVRVRASATATAPRWA